MLLPSVGRNKRAEVSFDDILRRDRGWWIRVASSGTHENEEELAES
jgi:hypothetical protein